MIQALKSGPAGKVNRVFEKPKPVEVFPLQRAFLI
jgi:hypothetical protein